MPVQAIFGPCIAVGVVPVSALHVRSWQGCLAMRACVVQVGTMLPVHLIQQNSSSLMRCTPSIECQPQYEHLAAGVVAVYAVDPRSHTVSLCSGVRLPLLVSHPWQAPDLSQVHYQANEDR